MKKFFKNRGGLRNAVFVFLIAFSAFLAFEPLFANLNQNAAQEFASAIFGTIFAAVITMVLLSKQTETEEEKSRSERVFEEKIDLYKQVIDILQDIFKKADNSQQVKMDKTTIIDLEFLLAKLIMVADEKTIHEFRLIYQNISRNYSPETGLLSLTSNDKHAVFRFSDYCREELGLSSKNIEKEILEDIVLEGELFYHLEKDDLLSTDILETLKDIYGFFVFERSVPLQRIVFEPDGFNILQNKDSKTPLLICKVNNQGIYITLTTHPVHKLKYFKFDANNTLHFAAQDRKRFLEDFENLKKTINLVN